MNYTYPHIPKVRFDNSNRLIGRRFGFGGGFFPGFIIGAASAPYFYGPRPYYHYPYY